MKDLEREFFELRDYIDIKNLKEETGDLLCSLIQLCNESGWEIDEVVESCLNKIESRYHQYRSLGRKYDIAILGGAFNPVHKGHIQLAQFVLNTSGVFDEVWLMPAYKHMYNKEMESPKDRLKMCELISKVDGRIKVFDYEVAHELSGETFNLACRLKEDQTLNDKFRFSFIIGQDNANGIESWVNSEELRKLVNFVVVSRQGIEEMENPWYKDGKHFYLKVEHEIMDISSTIVRGEINKFGYTDKLKQYVTDEVYNYIVKNELYQSNKKNKNMNIKELKKLITTLPDEMEIILQKDSEGNGYSPCAGGDPDCVYAAETTWSGDIYDPSWSAEDVDMEEEDWVKIQQRPRVLVFYPVN